MAPFTINGNLIEVTNGFLSNDDVKTNFIVLRTKSVLNEDQRKVLDNNGVTVENYLDSNTYLCHTNSSTASSLESSLQPLVPLEFAVPYQPDWKVHAELKRQQSDSTVPSAPPADRESDEVIKVRIVVLLHRSAPESGEDIARDLESKDLVKMNDCHIFSDRILTETRLESLQDIAHIDSIRVIERSHEVGFYNNVCRDIVNDSIYVKGVEKTGAGQVIAVADSGFDIGKIDDVHPAFTGRVLALYQVGLNRSNVNFVDKKGHGTHVCGSALGDGQLSTMAEGSKRIRGTAPGASLVCTSMLDPSGVFYDGPRSKVFQVPYTSHNACVHVCSWGAIFHGQQIGYTIATNDVDAFVNQNRDVLICFAAGNAGADVGTKAQIGGEPSAKNCLTVGSCKSARKSDDKMVYDARKALDDNPAEVAASSSRGPTTSGRIKPDLVAPGVLVLSAATRQNPSNDYQFGPSTDQGWAFMSGTSMANPIAAGCAAVLRQVLLEQFQSNPTPGADTGAKFPSAALLKALLINGAVPLPTKLPIPNNEQGFGRLNLEASIAPILNTEMLCFSDNIALKMDESSTPIEIDVPDAIKLDLTEDRIMSRLKVTLVWTDPPGDPTTSVLHLIVKFSDTLSIRERHGNMGPGISDYDDLNNVQQIDWGDLPAGKATISVHCVRTLSLASQHFSLGWSLERDI